MSTQVVGMHHVQLAFAPALTAVVERFYGQLLGLQRLPQNGPLGLSYAVGGQRIDLVPSAQTAPCVGAGHLALHVRGIEALHARLQAHGEVALALVSVAEGLRFYAKDPAGNTLELLQLQALCGPAEAQPSSRTGSQAAACAMC